jgi:hypothetical protein
MKQFQLLLYAFSLAHMHQDSDYFFQDISVRDLQEIGYVTGYSLLNNSMEH